MLKENDILTKEKLRKPFNNLFHEKIPAAWDNSIIILIYNKKEGPNYI